MTGGLDSADMTKKSAPEPPTSRSESGSAPAGVALTVERFSRLVEVIYEAALDPTLWSVGLEDIRHELSANYVSLIVRRATDGDPGLIVSVAGSRAPIDSDTSLIEQSPFNDIPLGRVVTDRDVVPGRDWRDSAYFRDWCAPHDVYHVVAADVRTRAGSVYGLRITRPEAAPAFSATDTETVRRLLPHLRQALDAYLLVNHDRQVSHLYGRAMAQLMVGAIVLDDHGKVIECNAAAREILDLQDGLRLVGDQLEATYANDNRKLQQLVRNAALRSSSTDVERIEAISINRPSGQLSWGVVVQEVSSDEWTEGKHRPSVAVFVRDTEGKAHPPTRLAQQLFQLTPAETALAIQLANGLSLEEAAAELSIRRNTARAHLRSIFSKTGVRRQTELVRLFLNSVAWLGASRE